MEKTGAKSWNKNVKHKLRAVLEKLLICYLPVLSYLPYLRCLPLNLMPNVLISPEALPLP